MSIKKPKISVLLVTYNRADLIEECVENLLQQRYSDIEIILVNNGCTDHTAEVLRKYEGHEKIRLFTIPENRGWQYGYNFALDQIRGEWFALVGDDDKIMPEAFEEMLQVVQEVDPSIDAVTANSIDINTGQMGGFGLDRDQYLPLEKIIQQTSGEFFGITKTSLLGDKRFNENLPGDSDTFYYKIDAIANRYYIHKALKVWGTPAVSNESSKYRAHNLEHRISLYRELLNEEFYWQALKKYNPSQYIARCIRGLFFQKIGGEVEKAQQYFQMGKRVYTSPVRLFLLYVLHLSPSILLRKAYALMGMKMVGNNMSKLMIKRYTTIRQN